MAHKHSFVITKSNNVTEKEGINYLTNNHTGFFTLNNHMKKELFTILDCDKKYLQAFDMIYVPNLVGKTINTESLEINIDDLFLIELKTTKKHLSENPKGFFFGATENEFNFAKLMGNRYKFCFVCLHEKSMSYVLLSLEELESKIRTKRIQYQINL